MCSKGPTWLFWFALFSWIVCILGPLIAFYQPTALFGLFSLTGLNWVPELIVATNSPGWVIGSVLSFEFGVLVLSGGFGIYCLAKGRVVRGFWFLLITGVVSLGVYPGPSIGPALMLATGAGGVYMRHQRVD
jgi:hypothetical protein